MTSYTPTTLNYPQLADTPIRRVKFDHAPNTLKNFILGDEWLDTSDTPNGQWWKLSTLATGGLVWVRIGGGNGNLQGLTGNTGGEVGPDSNANINILGVTPYTVSGNPTTHTLSITDNGGVAYTYTEDVGTATPFMNNINVLGGSGINTLGSANTITISGTGFAGTWTDEATNFAAVSNNGYFIIGNAIATLPASPANGDMIAFFVDGAFTVTITANTGQTIKVSSVTSAVAGTAANTATGDAMNLVYRGTNTRWECIGFVGLWVIT